MAGRAGLRAGRGASRTPSVAVRASPRHRARVREREPIVYAASGSGSGKENKAGSSTPLRHRPNVLSELDNATPRLMLRRIIQNQPQVSPVALQTVQLEEREDAQPEPPSQRTSST
ncbi:centromere protein T-like [Meleagris gallopavo]|uniref:centromere protein T-like n=1 Tax=Meleagris gallopavo TaxID=9103 RepID=UPI0012ABC491|nr:centromere protein T-like [Meleagris gallopavo]